MVKRVGDKYHPGNIPETLDGIRVFLFDELWRIAAALSELPVALGVSVVGFSVPVSPAPVETNVFIGAPAVRDNPGGAWDPITGTWKAPVTGLYQINVTTTLAPFGVGNKQYQVDLILYIDDVETYRVSWSGDDNFPLTNILAIAGGVNRDSVLRVMLLPGHDQFTGNVLCDANWTIGLTAQE